MKKKSGKRRINFCRKSIQIISKFYRLNSEKRKQRNNTTHPFELVEKEEENRRRRKHFLPCWS